MRIRVRFGKVGKIRFLGNLDLARCWERAIRRAELPVAYSEGFSPRPKLHYGLALPLGAESLAEYLDIDLRDEIDLVGLDKALGDALPEGVEVTAVAEVASNATALQAIVDRCTWQFDLAHDATHVRAEVERAIAADELPLTIERKRKQITEDVRGAIGALSVGPLPGSDLGTGGAVLTADLVMKPRSLRPAELLTCLRLGEARRTCRVEQWMTIDGRPEPLLAAAVPVAAGPSARRPER